MQKCLAHEANETCYCFRLGESWNLSDTKMKVRKRESVFFVFFPDGCVMAHS